jgi:hypothetical protein
MGHQIDFYLLPIDLLEIEQDLHHLTNFSILHSNSITDRPRIIDTTDFMENGTQWLYLYLVRPGDLEHVTTRYVPNQRHWIVDELRSSAIELNRCFFDGKILRRGRLYYVDGFYGEDGQWQDKPEEFKRWAKSILARVKKRLKRSGNFYLGAEAEKWLASGAGALVP